MKKNRRFCQKMVRIFKSKSGKDLYDEKNSYNYDNNEKTVFKQLLLTKSKNEFHNL